MEWLERILIKAIQKSLDKSIYDLNKIDSKIRMLGLQNEQWFLDWQDKLNEISVR